MTSRGWLEERTAQQPWKHPWIHDRQHHWKQQNLNAHDHCGIAKIFVGELVETAKGVMRERSETGPIRPCHIREAYRRLKLEGNLKYQCKGSLELVFTDGSFCRKSVGISGFRRICDGKRLSVNPGR
ncbi:transcription initiation factor TFIID subunit 11 [Tanacetum coccineum]